MTRKNNEDKEKAKKSGVLEERYGLESVEKIKGRAKKLFLVVSFFLISWIVSGKEFAFSTYPFGIALIAASATMCIPISVGFFMAYILGEMGRGYLFSYITVMVARLIMSFAPMPSASREINIVTDEGEIERDAIEGEVKKKSGVIWQVLSIFNIGRDKRNEMQIAASRQMDLMCALYAAVGGFVVGLFDLIENDFSFYSLYGMAFMTFFCPVLAYFLVGATSKEKSELRFDVAIGLIAFLCIFASGDIMVFGMMLKPVIAIASVLFVTHKKGLFAGALFSLFAGATLGYLYLPLVIVCAIAYGMLVKIKSGAAIAAVCGCVVVYCYYIGGTNGIIDMLTPMLFGVPVFLVIKKTLDFIYPRSNADGKKCDMYFAEAVIERDKNLAVRGSIHALSDAFSSLSKTFYELSDVFHRPDALHLRDITDEAFSKVCQGCRNREICYGSDYNKILEINSAITSALHTKGYAARDDVGNGGCIRLERILSEANTLCSKYTEELIKNQKVHAFASNFEDVNHTLLDAISKDEGEYECDIKTGEGIFEYLTSIGLNINGVVVRGKRCKRVTVRGFMMNESMCGTKASSVCENVSKIMGEEMCGPVFEVSNDGTDMIFTSKPKYSVICSHGRRAAFEGMIPASEKEAVNPFDDSVAERREELCGDVVGAFITGSSYFYSMICDGMGSGRDAALCAGICSSFSEKMLSAGNRVDTTLRMLNNFLRSENCDNGKECSVALDIFELDLMRGGASFVKSGGVPTYVWRGGKVYKVASRTMPIGIIKSPDIKISKLDMQRGDIVVMMSDGCSHDSDDCKWLIELLCDESVEKAEDLLEKGEKIANGLLDKILERAKIECHKQNISDDISASVIIVI